MEYKLEKATLNDIDKLIEYKKNTIYEYANNIDEEEINKIDNYIINEVPKLLDDYLNIIVDGKKVGCVLITKKDDGKLLDEIYLEEDYRCLGIGSMIIKNILESNNIVYLWVYKDNIKAIKLYKRLGFNIITETDSRYYMKYSRGD